MNVIFIIGNPPASQIAAEAFRAAGNRVYPAAIEHAPAVLKEIRENENRLDMLVFAPEMLFHDGDICAEHNPDEVSRQIEHNLSGFYQAVEGSRQLLRAGKKRICVLTEKNASIRRNTAAKDFGYHMSLAAVNMMEKIFFNALRGEGFTFRCFAADGEGGLDPAVYFSMDLCYDPGEPYTHSDENRLVFRDRWFDEVAW